MWGIVTSVEHASNDIQLLEVALDDRTVGPAIALPWLSGPCGVADRVLVNSTGSSLESAAGVRAIVVTKVGAAEGVAYERRGNGRTLKLRHTPAQTDVGCVEEKDSRHYQAMRQAVELAGMPVACCGLPGQVFAVAVAAKAVAPDVRIAFVMTDEGALTLAISDSVRAARASGVIDTTVTSGQAVGGEIEALNLHSGLLAARHAANADIAIVAPGPGVPGMTTPFGHAGVAQGVAINAVGALGGLPLPVLRLASGESGAGADGVVHAQTLTALLRVALVSSVIAVPALPEDIAETLDYSLEAAGVWERHRRVDVTRVPERAMTAVRERRGRAEDAASASAASAVGVLCSRFATGESSPPLMQ